MSELKVEVKASVGNGQTRTKAEAHVVPPVNAILDEIESIKAEQVEQNKAIADNLEEAKKYTDEEIATFDIIKVVNGDPETGLPLVENPLPNRFYLVPKTNTTDKDFFDTYVWANKGTEENPDYVWDFQGTKKVEVDLVEYVKFTDYITNTKAGLIDPQGFLKVIHSGLIIDEENHILRVRPCEEGMIRDRVDYNNQPITLKVFDKGVKAVLTDPKVELSEDSTDESGNAVEGEKTKACKWLGASRATNWRNGKGLGSVQNNSERDFVTGADSIAWNSSCGGGNSFAGGASGGIWAGVCSFMWARNSNSYGTCAVTFGEGCSSNQDYTFLYGIGAKSEERMSISLGQYNAYENETDWLFSIGNGASNTERSNALIVYKDGHAKFDGTVEVEAPQNDKDAVNKKHAEDNFVPRNFVSSNGLYGKMGMAEYFYELSQWGAGGGENTIARRTSKGGLRVFLDETNDKPEDMATPRGYVDGKISELQAQIDALKGQS